MEVIAARDGNRSRFLRRIVLRYCTASVCCIGAADREIALARDYFCESTRDDFRATTCPGTYLLALARTALTDLRFTEPSATPAFVHHEC